MRMVLAAAAVMMAGQAAARDCRNGSAEVLSVSDWAAEMGEPVFGSNVVDLHVTLESALDQDVRMVDAVLYFDDILGRGIVNLSVDQDARIPAGGSLTQSDSYQAFAGSDILRIVTAEQSDIVTTVCVSAVVTASGDVVRFD